MNILLITLDQFRGDALSCAGHPLVKTPNLDALAAEGTRFARHYSQAAPCAPGRASLYTGLYQMNHRVVANGTPLDARFDSVALAARRAGYAPVLFGYTDQSVDPRATDGPHDRRLESYEGILPGFEEGLHLPESAPTAWLEWLTSLGHALPVTAKELLAQEPLRPAVHSITAFLTDRFLTWLGQQDRPWFAHVSHLRPHPPYAAAGHFSKMYDPGAVARPIAAAEQRHPSHDMLLRLPVFAAPADETELRWMTAQYFGMVSECDFQLGRVWDALKASGQWDDTVIVVTSDHGEMLGDHGLKQKGGFFEQSYHIPAIVRDPRGARGRVVTHFTEAVDIFPTLCEAMGIPVPAQCDGVPLTPFLNGETPYGWRCAAHWEFDWRGWFIPHVAPAAPWERGQEKLNLAVIRDAETAYVHFGDGTSLCFDLVRDPTWRTLTTDPARHIVMAERMLTWRAQHLDRTLTGLLVSNGGVGRWPEMPKGWGER